MKKIYTSLVIASLLLTGCAQQETPKAQPPQTTATQQAKKPMAQNEFDLLTLKVGDSIMEMKVDEVGPFKEQASSNGEKIASLNDQNYFIKFSGEKTLTGTYTYNGDEEPFTANQVCFEPDLDSLKTLPTINGNPTSFCLINDTLAKKRFKKGTSGKAKILINQLNLVYYPIEVWDTANLIKIY